MAEAPLLLVLGPQAWLVRPGPGRPERFPLGLGDLADVGVVARRWLGLVHGEGAPPGIEALRGALPTGTRSVRVGDAAARALVERAGLKAEEAPARLVAAARERLLSEGGTGWARASLLGLGEVALEARLASPEEMIISLSREAERLDRLLRREEESFAALRSGARPGTPVAAYLDRSTAHVEHLQERRRDLDRSLEQAVLRLLPNTAAVLGPRTAGRLLALAGSPQALLRMPASRLQVLGARRRRPGLPGARHGSIYAAEGMDRVAPGRRGALARSLASMASIALRADLLTHGSIGLALVERRERRVQSLGAGWRPRPRRGAYDPQAEPLPGEVPSAPVVPSRESFWQGRGAELARPATAAPPPGARAARRRPLPPRHHRRRRR